ncbi:MAG: hypothetical protein NVV63_03845 [Opitutus sp.]|nr:hypothetical protein [Opitutus sp.]
MKTYTALAVLGAIAMVSSGCATGPENTGTNPKQPGPAVGQAVGAVTGAVVGNVAGAVAGAAEGASAAAKKPFTNERHYVRTWKEEKDRRRPHGESARRRGSRRIRPADRVSHVSATGGG